MTPCTWHPGSATSASDEPAWFGGLFPWTLGEQRSLREGFLGILDRAALELDDSDPSSATAVRACAAHLRLLPVASDDDAK